MGDGVGNTESIKLMSTTDTNESEVTDKKANRKWSTHERITVITLLLGQVCIFMVFALMAPFFAQEAKKMNATALETAIVFSAFQLVVILLSPVCGKLVSWS